MDTKELIAKHQILDVISQYSYNWGSKNPDDFAEIFTEDATWEWWPPGAQNPGVGHKSRKKFRDWAADRFNTSLADH
ncbi:MAG: nuclear transport factor 2 family protein [Candidatus Hodarchaeota archaeon]